MPAQPADGWPRNWAIAPEDVIPSSTGVIGHHLPMDRFQQAIAGKLRNEMRPDGLDLAAEAIMTTDTRPKRIAKRVGGAVLAGIAKGAGMIEPDMATMLAFVFTDAALSPAVLRPMLQRSVHKSFNMISVDTDTSTSDTVIAMANGLAGDVDLDAFQSALDEVCIHLAKEVARDGEGASKLIEVAVTLGARRRSGQGASPRRLSTPRWSRRRCTAPTRTGGAWPWLSASAMRKRTFARSFCAWRSATPVCLPWVSRRTWIWGRWKPTCKRRRCASSSTWG